MLKQLQQVPDFVWGQYLFSRDILTDKISEEQKGQMIASSVTCGYETAKELQKKSGSLTVEELIGEENISITHQSEECIGNRILFALYQSPDRIMIMDNPIQKICSRTDVPEEIQTNLSHVILGHELFHHIECKHSNMYTQKEKVKLWKFLFYTHYSNVRATSEIAAMCFSKAINQVDFPAFLLDILLVYAYDENQAIEMYHEVIELYQKYLNK